MSSVHFRLTLSVTLCLIGQRHFGEIWYCKWWYKNVIGIRYGGGGMHDLM